MSLVAYDNSDSSEFEDDCNDKPEKNSPAISDQPAEAESKQNGGHIFNQLPQPKIKKNNVTEEDDEFLHKKEDPTNVPKPKAKILVPSLSDFKDVNDTVKQNKPRSNNGKKSGLLGILPQPRNAYTTSLKSLIPQVLTTKKPESLKKALHSTTSNQATKIVTNPIVDSDDSDDDNEQTDFFAINKPIEVPIVDILLDTESNVKTASSISKTTTDRPAPRNVESYFKTIEDKPGNSNESNQMSIDHNVSQDYEQQEQYASSSNRDVALNEEALLKLCGTRGKRKREDIQIVDINQQDVLDDARQWLLKGLMDDTSKRTSSSKRKGNEPTNQQKRKHQITYLAHQAKANEAELQNQWANNRMSKRQTQSKYGF